MKTRRHPGVLFHVRRGLIVGLITILTVLATSSSAAPVLETALKNAPADQPATTAIDDEAPLPITRGDTLVMQVFGKPDLGVTGEVAEDGSFLVPLVGPVQVAGLSASQAAAQIAQALIQGEYLVNAQVSVTIKETQSRQVSVLGEVGKSGRFPIAPNMTIFDLLAVVGGVTQEAGPLMYLIRKDAQGQVSRTEINLTELLSRNPTLPDIRLTGGDTLFVPRASRFYISGEVNQPGQFKLEPGMTVLQAIARAGGVNRRGSTSRVDIKRTRPDGTLSTRSAHLSDEVQADDVIQVKESLF